MTTICILTDGLQLTINNDGKYFLAIGDTSVAIRHPLRLSESIEYAHRQLKIHEQPDYLSLSSKAPSDPEKKS